MTLKELRSFIGAAEKRPITKEYRDEFDILQRELILYHAWKMYDERSVSENLRVRPESGFERTTKEES